MKFWCTANSNLAYFIELTTAHECQKQLLMSSISNLGGRESLEIAVSFFDINALRSGYILMKLNKICGHSCLHAVQEV